MTTNTKWCVRFNKTAQKQFEKLDPQIQRQIQRFLREKLLTAEHPRLLGKPLTGNLNAFWRYRVNDYRIICKIEDKDLIILIVEVAHRKEVYE